MSTTSVPCCWTGCDFYPGVRRITTRFTPFCNTRRCGGLVHAPVVVSDGSVQRIRIVPGHDDPRAVTGNPVQHFLRPTYLAYRCRTERCFVLKHRTVHTVLVDRATRQLKNLASTSIPESRHALHCIAFRDVIPKWRPSFVRRSRICRLAPASIECTLVFDLKHPFFCCYTFA